MASNGESAETRELALVGKVEMRIALADSDRKLESLLKTFLVPLLLKLASPYVGVRNKVIAVCQHVNTRIKAPSVQLPVAALLKQFKEVTNTLVRHFDLLYLQQGFERLPTSKRLEILPVVLMGISRNYDESAKSAASLFNVFLKLLHPLQLPLRGSKEDDALREQLGLQDPEDAGFVASWLGKLILFSPSTSTAQAFPGLSAEDYESLQMYGKPEAWIPTAPGGLSLTETKVRAAKLLSSGAFSEAERFLPALYASADTNSRLSDLGDDMLKRATPAISLEDCDMVDRLMTLYLGSTETFTYPVRPSLQIKILNLLSKSKRAASYASETVRIVEAELLSSSEGTSKQGLEASRLRQQVFGFVNWVARMAPADVLTGIAPGLVENLKRFVKSQGWVTMNEAASGSAAELASRAFAYESIGSLAKSCPQQILLKPDLTLLTWLFISLAGNASGPEVSLSIEHALSNVLGAFAVAQDPNPGWDLPGLLLRFMRLAPGETGPNGMTVVRSTRYIAVRFANRCAPFHDVSARLIDVLALSNGPSERNEVIEEGRKGLDPHWYRNLNPTDTATDLEQDLRYAMPAFEDLVFALLDSTDLQHGLLPAVEFCFAVLFHRALASGTKAPSIDVDWSRNIDALISNDEDARSAVRAYLGEAFAANKKATDAMNRLLAAAFDGLRREFTGDKARFGELLLRIFSIAPQKALGDQTNQLKTLEPSTVSNDHAQRSTACHLFGILSSGTTVEPVINSLQAFLQKAKTWKDAIGSTVNQIHGSILAVAYYSSRSFTGDADELRAACTDLILEILADSHDNDLMEAATIAADQLSLFGKLSSQSLSGKQTTTLLDRLEAQTKEGDEKAVLALGRFAMQCPEEHEDESHLTRIIQTLYALHEKRQPELHFAVGSALSCAASGWDSKALIGANDVDASLTNCARERTLSSMLDKILNDCKQTKPALRAASVIWLLSIVQYCGHLSEVQARLRLCQKAFKGFLADREPLNQEAASRGLTLVYDKGDKDIKDDLIHDLVGSFTETKSTLAGSVDPDTELFEPGALPTGEGSSVTTYKDIVNLASEVGDPSLVYRFMSLAANSSVWSGRAAFGRFGLGRILADSGDGYLTRNPKLYAALFRYRFDPNSNVRAAMSDIWTAMVSDSSATIETHFDAILTDLLKNIVNKEWRTRQACCAAIADLIQGRPLAMYEKRLTEVWTMAFKVSDDIKDSVRVAAMALARVLTGVLTRNLEAGEATAGKANAMLEQVLPFLLGPSGLESGAKDVQMFALVTLLDVIKKASSKALRPFLPELVSHLVALLSSIEPEAVNYLHLNADKYGMTEQQIDDARLSSVRSSPMMEAIERCLDMLDEESMRALDEALRATVKSVIGLPSKVGASRVVVSLATRGNLLFKPYADGFLRLLRGQVLDRNDTVSTSAATACGYLARIASQEENLRLVTYAQKLYFESADERHRMVAGELVLAFSKHASDRFAAIGSSVLPFTYFGTHDEHEEVRDLFHKAWGESVGGSRAVLLYLGEIIDLALAHLEALSWSIKHASALAVAGTVHAAGTGAHVSEADARRIWPALEKAVGGKTWEGKEKVLAAVVPLAKSLPLLESDASFVQQLQVSGCASITSSMYEASNKGGNATSRLCRPILFLHGQPPDAFLAVADTVGGAVIENHGTGGEADKPGIPAPRHGGFRRLCGPRWRARSLR